LSLLYSIRNWNDWFENNRSRSIKALSWVGVPNRHDGENYTAIVSHKDGAEIFAAWNLIVQVASKCEPRGVLTRGCGRPHDAASLALKTRAPKIWFEKALKYLSENTDWLDITEFASQRQETDAHLTPTCPQSTLGGKEGGIGRTGPRAEVIPQFPDVLQTDAFKAAWARWVKHRKEIRKPLTETSIETQLKEFSEWGEARSIAAIEFTIKKGWQGLAEPKTYGSQTSQRVNQRNLGIARPTIGADYGEAAKRKLVRQTLEAQNRESPKAQGDGGSGGFVLHGDLEPASNRPAAGTGGQ
jgi:hypothetical protein